MDCLQAKQLAIARKQTLPKPRFYLASGLTLSAEEPELPQLSRSAGGCGAGAWPGSPTLAASMKGDTLVGQGFLHQHFRIKIYSQESNTVLVLENLV